MTFEKAKRQAARILDNKGIKSGKVILADIITVHGYNCTRKTFMCNWHGNNLGERETPNFVFNTGIPKDRRSFVNGLP